VDIKKTVNDLKGLFESKEEVSLAFVFGSFVEGRLTPESDIDIAILFKESPCLDLLSDIREDIYKITGREADIVILNHASPIIRMQVLKKGMLLKRVNEGVYNEFFVKTIKEYDDLKRIRRPQEDNILRGRIYARA